MDMCLSEMKDLIIISVVNKYVIASLNAMNSIAELLPAWLAWRVSKKVHFKRRPHYFFFVVLFIGSIQNVKASSLSDQLTR